MISDAIIVKAITARTENECTKSGCPKRTGHKDNHVVADFAWEIPADWTLANQMHFSRQLQHGASIASDMPSHPSFGNNMAPMFANYDNRYAMSPGQTREALAAYAAWVAAAAIATNDTPRPSAPAVPPVDAEPCIETDYDRRGDCDGADLTVELLANNHGHRVDERHTMCRSHARQAVKKGEVRIIDAPATAGSR